MVATDKSRAARAKWFNSLSPKEKSERMRKLAVARWAKKKVVDNR